MLHKEINLLAGYTGRFVVQIHGSSFFWSYCLTRDYNTRVWDLLALLDTLQAKPGDNDETAIRAEYEQGESTKFEEVSIVTPDGLVLVEGMSYL